MVIYMPLFASQLLDLECFNYHDFAQRKFGVFDSHKERSVKRGNLSSKSKECKLNQNVNLSHTSTEIVLRAHNFSSLSHPNPTHSPFDSHSALKHKQT